MSQMNVMTYLYFSNYPYWNQPYSIFNFQNFVYLIFDTQVYAMMHNFYETQQYVA
jgi:hypothetical protein